MYSNCNLTLFSLSQTIVTRGLVALSKTKHTLWLGIFGSRTKVRLQINNK